MDCFDSHYYLLNRKLLSFIGQWPYQNFADKFTRRILYITFLVLSDIPEVASVMTKELDFNQWIQIVCAQVTGLLVVLRTFLFTFNTAEVLELLELIKLNWRSLTNKDEFEIFHNAAEEGRLKVLYYITIFSVGVTLNIIFFFSRSILKSMNLLNGSDTREFLYEAKYFIDDEKYYYVIVTHMMLVGIGCFIGVVASDAFFVVFMYHNIGLFKIACYQLEHAFDICNDKANDPQFKATICQRFARAVEWHKRALRFRDGIIGATLWLNFISLGVSMIDICVVFYWIVVTNGQGLGPLMGVILVIHAFWLNYPAQRIADSSMQIPYKA